MELVSIYEHMETGASKVPGGQNCKIIFRHSIRGKIESGGGREVSLIDEGIELCKSFGRNLQYDIGYVASSTCLRNIQTCENILLGKDQNRNIVKAPKELEYPQTKDRFLSDKVFEELKFNSQEIIFKLKKEGLEGFNSIQESAKIMLDYIFSNGSLENTVDLYCTHDFQMAILYAYLFDFASTRESIENNKWPMMLEGMIFWGERNHFWCSWRNEIKEFVNT
ncbi:hypothetical protein E4N71_12200 [Treponema vincentii]|uniref:hypothetical protein n=1 Tax=Treponema vincentii TaxID=69710 RepID=UPI003D924BD4